MPARTTPPASPTPPGLARFLAREPQDQAEIVYPWELPSIMRKHIYTGAMGTAYMVLTSGLFLVSLGNSLGIQYWHWAALSTLSSAVLVLQLVSAFIVTKLGARKRLWYVTSVLCRMLRAGAVVALYWLAKPMPQTARLTFLVLLVLGNASGALGTPPWLSWLADIIPEQQHGRFMGRRSAWLALANMAVSVPLALAVDWVPEDAKVAVLMAGFALGFAVGILDLVIHRTIPEPLMPSIPQQGFWRSVRAPLADPAFRPWLVFNAVWTFAMTLGGSLSMVHFVQNLGIRRNMLGGSLVLIMLPLIGTTLTARLMGKLIDRYGVRRMLFVGHLLWATLPGWWLLARPENALLWLGVGAVTGGIGSATALIAAQKLITRLRSSEQVSMYAAVSTCTANLTGALGPLVAGLTLQLLDGRTWSVGPFTLIGFHAVFLMSFVLRMSATVLIRRVHEPSDETRSGQ
jgi:MFS family permease